MSLPYLLILILAFGGFWLAFYIHHTKRNKEVLVCPVGTTCNEVVHSEFSKFFGLPVEVIGMLYYGAIFLGYGVFLAFSDALFLEHPIFLLLIFSLLAFLFSAYLTFVQAFFLKQWCTWCLISAGLCTIIFGLAVFYAQIDILFMLDQYAPILSVVYFFGLALGLGSATVADVLFFKFLKDLRIAEWEADILRTVSQVVWFSLAVIILSILGYYLPSADVLNQSPVFRAGLAVGVILLLNGAMLNLFITPKLVRISFGKRHEHEAGELSSLRRWAFVLGGISMVSWYTFFVLGVLPKETETPFSYIIYIYLVLLLIAASAGRVIEGKYAKKEV